MKKTFKIKDEVAEAIYNKQSKKLTIKFWIPIEGKIKMYENWTTYTAYNSEIDDFYNCSLRDILYIDKDNFIAGNKYPYAQKHISKFNIY